MKIANIARVSEDKNKTRVTQLLDLIDQNPGISAIRLHRMSGIPEGTITSTLSRMSRKGQVVKRRLDGRIRLYPRSYRLPADPKVVTSTWRCTTCNKELSSGPALRQHIFMAHTPGGEAARAKAVEARRKGTEVPPTPPSNFNQELVTKAKDYAWDYPESAGVIRQFVEWCNKER